MPTGFMSVVGAYNPELLTIYEENVNNVFWPNAEKLIAFFREKKMPIIYTYVSQDKNVHPRLHPREGRNEWVILAPHPGVFLDTNLDQILKNNKIYHLFFVGFNTSHCVAFSIFAAMDRGYLPILITDATVDCRPDHYKAILQVLGLHAYLQTTANVMNDYPWQKWIDPEAPPPLPQGK